MRRQLLAALRDQLDGGKKRPPEAGVFLWNAFNQLSRARTWHAHGPNPITFPEIEAFCRLTRLPLEPRHVAILREMDQAWLTSTLAQVGKPQGQTIGPVSKHALTPALLDLMFG